MWDTITGFATLAIVGFVFWQICKPKKRKEEPPPPPLDMIAVCEMEKQLHECCKEYESAEKLLNKLDVSDQEHPTNIMIKWDRWDKSLEDQHNKGYSTSIDNSDEELRIFTKKRIEKVRETASLLIERLSALQR